MTVRGLVTESSLTVKFMNQVSGAHAERHNNWNNIFSFFDFVIFPVLACYGRTGCVRAVLCCRKKHVKMVI